MSSAQAMEAERRIVRRGGTADGRLDGSAVSLAGAA